LLRMSISLRLRTMTQNLRISELMIARLIELGSHMFVISPGSRSTPLTVAAARNPNARTRVHFDERGAAYFALGHAKSTGKPAVLICTSGTAVANYFPAVIEASMDNIPMIILSADRPPELIGVGANQAIYQSNIYGKYPRLFKNLDPPEEDTSTDEVLEIVRDAYSAALGSRPGPVHLNCQFREPLLPPSSDIGEISELSAPTKIRDPSHLDGVNTERSRSARHDTLTVTPPVLQQAEFDLVHHHISRTKQGLIVVGRGVDTKYDDAILNLAKILNWPVFPDVQSKLRFRVHPNIVNHFDLALRKEDVFSRRPEMVIHFGSAFTSKRLLQYLNKPEIFYVSVKETPEQIDPNHQVDVVLHTEIDEFCRNVASSMGLREPQPPDSHSAWIMKWQKLEDTVSESIDSQLGHKDALTEPGISYHLSKMIPRNHSLMLANSMPIRDMEMFGSYSEFGGNVIANRGSSGIDGLLATAAGCVAGTQRPLTFLMGDLAALHDLNSLSLISQSVHPVIIVLINNNGGGIFNFLPIESETDVFESFFGTPHGWTFEKAADMFDIPYFLPNDMQHFRQVYAQAVQSGDSAIIELRTERSENHSYHKSILKRFRESR